MKARQDIGCKFGLRPNLLLTLAFAASFFRFVRSALSVLTPGISKRELDRI